MYYEEQWIEGALCWRTSPDGAWTRYTANELAHRYESAEKRAADAQATVEVWREAATHVLTCMRAVDAANDFDDRAAQIEALGQEGI